MPNQTPDLPGIAANAVDAAGGSAKLGRALGLRKTTVQSWKSSRIPAEWMPRISVLTGIPMRDLRPDLFGPPAGEAFGQSLTPAEVAA